jgi:hypothetical protein
MITCGARTGLAPHGDRRKRCCKAGLSSNPAGEANERGRTWARWSRPAPRDLDPHPGRGGRLSPSRVHQIVAVAAWMRWTRRSARCGQRAGQHRKIPILGRTPNSAAGITSSAGYPVRWAGCDSVQTGSRIWTLIATRQRSPAPGLRLAEPDLEVRASAPADSCPFPHPRTWSGPGTPRRPSGTSAARPASGQAPPITRSGRAARVPAFGKLDAVAVLAARLLLDPLPWPHGRQDHRACSS